ncbi:MAG: hypothetical protein VX642_11340 [Bdellovibrionota bacterium]|nr:hypothetical protein [Bdellovibrionota bacterium]
MKQNFKNILTLALFFLLCNSLRAQELDHENDVFEIEFFQNKQAELNAVLEQLDELIKLKKANNSEEYQEKFEVLAEELYHRALDQDGRKSLEIDIYETLSRLRILNEPELDINLLRFILYTYQSKSEAFLPITVHRVIHYVLVEKGATVNLDELAKYDTLLNLFKNFREIPGEKIFLEKSFLEMKEQLYHGNVLNRLAELSLVADYQKEKTAKFLMESLLNIDEKMYSMSHRDNTLKAIESLLPYSEVNRQLLLQFWSSLETRFLSHGVTREIWHTKNLDWVELKNSSFNNWREKQRAQAIKKQEPKMKWSDFVREAEEHKATSFSSLACRRSAK